MILLLAGIFYDLATLWMSETGVDVSFLRKECVWLVILCNVGNFFGNSYNCALLTMDESEFFLNDLDFIIYPILSC